MTAYPYETHDYDVVVVGAGGAGLLNELDSRANAIFAQSAPVGLDGKQDMAMDNIDRLSSRLQALDQMAAENPKAAEAYLQALRERAVIAP